MMEIPIPIGLIVFGLIFVVVILGFFVVYLRDEMEAYKQRLEFLERVVQELTNNNTALMVDNKGLKRDMAEVMLRFIVHDSPVKSATQVTSTTTPSGYYYKRPNEPPPPKSVKVNEMGWCLCNEHVPCPIGRTNKPCHVREISDAGFQIVSERK